MQQPLRSLIRLLSLTILLSTGFLSPVQAQDRDEIEAVLRELLQEHPEVVYQAMERYMKQRQDEVRRAQASALETNLTAFLQAGPSFGPDDASVTIVEWFDYNCGYCKRSLAPVMNVLQNDGDVRVVFLEYPILAPSSETAARAALAAHRQGRYLEFHRSLMEHRGALTNEGIMETAAASGLDLAQLRRDMEAPEIQATLDRVREISDSLDVRGTPAFLVGTELIPGAVDEDRLRTLIEQARAS